MFLKALKPILTFLIALTFITTCTLYINHCPSDYPKHIVVKNVETVFLNESHRYTFIVRNGNISEPIELSSSSVRFKYDIKSDENIYAEYDKKCEMGAVKNRNLIIHLHGKNEIEGGGWNHGKFGKGNTTKIE